METKCINLEGLLKFELDYAEKTLGTDPKHLEFFEMYGLDLRREYCGSKCYARHNCQIAQVYIRDKGTD